MDFSTLTPNTLNYLRTQLTGFPLGYNPLLFQELELHEILSIRSMHYTIYYADVARWNERLDQTAGIASLVGYPLVFKGGFFLKLMTLLGSLCLSNRQSEESKRKIPPYRITEVENKAYALWSELFQRVSDRFPRECSAWWAAFHDFGAYCKTRNDENLMDSEFETLRKHLEKTSDQLSGSFRSFIPFSNHIKDAYSFTNLYMTGIYLIIYNTGIHSCATEEALLFCQHYSDEELFHQFKKYASNLPSSQLLAHLGHPVI